MSNNKLKMSGNCRFAIYFMLSLIFGVSQLNAQTYCVSKGNLPWTEWIAGVKFGTINSSTSKEGYGDFTSQTTNLARGTSYPLSITQGFSYAPDAANATQQGKVWIDYNKNGTFEASELVASFTRTTTTANVVIPTTALLGATRMRVSLKTIGAPTACEVFDKGEVEDYTVNITGGTTTTGRDTLRITNVTGATTAEPSGTLPLSITIKNFGAVASKPDSIGLWKWRYYDATYSVPYSVNKVAIPTIAAGQSITVTGNFQMPATLVDVSANVGDVYVGVDAAVKTYIYYGCSYYGSSDDCLGFRYPIKPATTTDLAVTGTVVQGLYSTNNLQVSFKVKLKNLGAKGAKNISVALNNYFSDGGGQYSGVKNVAFVSGAGTYKYITVYRSVDVSNQYSTWQIPNLNARDSVEATFTGDIAYYPGGQPPLTSDIAPYVLYADVQDSNSANDKTALTFNLANANTCRYQDSLSLVRLYVATGGADWTIKWNLTTPINTWSGITLNAEGCVSRINLMNNNLIGTIPNLTFPNLELLDMNYNSLKGNMPTFNTPKLGSLNLSYNQLTGTIPAFDFTTTNLGIIDLSHNQLSGSIPNFNLSGAYLIKGLSILDLNHNKLTGAIPKFRLVNLYKMDLSYNQLSDTIPSLLGIPQLRGLDLSNNQLTGSFPIIGDGFRSESGYITLDSNRLSGCIPNTLKSYCSGGPYNTYPLVSFKGNPNLATQSYDNFCNFGTGACTFIPTANLNITGLVLRDRRTDPILNQYAFVQGSTVGGSVGIAPDIYPLSGAVSASNISPTPFQTKVRAYISKDRLIDANDYVLSETTYTIAPNNGNWNNYFVEGGYGFGSGRIPVNFPVGNYFLIIKIDADNTLLETNENDNLDILNFPIIAPPVLNSCRTQDSLQLVSLYNATNGANWTNKWNLATPINTWYGVTLNANGCVESLASPGNNLVGTLPNLNLPNVLTLALPNNLLSGTLPNLSLPNVTQFILYNNKFTGALPNLNLPNVINIDLNTNLFTGAIPNLSLPKLVNLTLNSSKFSGTIPNFNLPKLENLNLFDNQLSGAVPNFTALPNLKTLVLQTNQLTGSIPSFTALPNLIQLELSNNLLSGCLPVYLKTLCGKTVNFTNNPSLANQDFATFCANNTGACVVVSNSCRTQDSLQLVSLYNATNGANWTKKWNLATPINTWSGVILNANGCVESIDLTVNNLRGTLPNLNMSKLNVLYLGGNILTGSIPNFNLPDLNILTLNSNSLSGTVPNFNLPTLQDIDLGKNQLTGALPNFNGLPIISSIQIYENKLSGSIPNFNLPTLRTLTLSTNQLTGTIPNLSLAQLDNLNLSNNLLTGSLPNFNLPNITGMYLSNNKLSGCIPASFKAFCGKGVDISANPSLATQDFAAFCNTNTGACGTGGGTATVTLSIAATPSVYQQYQTTTFKITAKNTGTTATAGTKIEFKFPVKTVSGGATTASIGAFQEWCSGGVQCFTWTIPSLAAGATATLDVPLFVLDATAPIVATTKVLDVPATSTNVATITVNRAGAAQAPPSQALAFKVPTQLIPVIIQRISPNPTEGDVQIKLDSWTKQTVDFNFSDITGKVIHSEKRDVEKGLNRVNFEVFHLPQGVYFIQTNVGKGKDVPSKFVKM
jgi:Leucine-rich repeat (LRR) protein